MADGGYLISLYCGYGGMPGGSWTARTWLCSADDGWRIESQPEGYDLQSVVLPSDEPAWRALTRFLLDADPEYILDGVDPAYVEVDGLKGWRAELVADSWCHRGDDFSPAHLFVNVPDQWIEGVVSRWGGLKNFCEAQIGENGESDLLETIREHIDSSLGADSLLTDLVKTFNTEDCENPISDACDRLVSDADARAVELAATASVAEPVFEVLHPLSAVRGIGAGRSHAARKSRFVRAVLQHVKTYGTYPVGSFLFEGETYDFSHADLDGSAKRDA